MSLISYQNETSKNGKDRVVRFSMFHFIESWSEAIQFIDFNIDWYRKEPYGKFFKARLEILNFSFFDFFISWGSCASDTIKAIEEAKLEDQSEI